MKKYGFFVIIFLIAIAIGYAYWRFLDADTRRFRITFLNVGQGDASLIQFRNGERWLVDCGPDSSVLSELGRVLPWFERSLDKLVVTHPDSDHYAGCIDVLNRYRVKHIVLSGSTKNDERYRIFAEATMHEPDATVVVEQAPERVVIAQTLIEFFSPDPTLNLAIDHDDSNNRSIVFRLFDELTQKTVLFTADMEMPLEQALLQKYCPRRVYEKKCPALEADVLKVGHHGSETSTSGDFLLAVHPKQAVISVGKRNRFGHPSLRVIRRLERSSIKILRTDREGAIVID